MPPHRRDADIGAPERDRRDIGQASITSPSVQFSEG